MVQVQHDVIPYDGGMCDIFNFQPAYATYVRHSVSDLPVRSWWRLCPAVRCTQRWSHISHIRQTQALSARRTGRAIATPHARRTSAGPAGNEMCHSRGLEYVPTAFNELPRLRPHATALTPVDDSFAC